MDRLLASKARDGDTVLVARGGTAVGEGAHANELSNTGRLHVISRRTIMKTRGGLTGSEVSYGPDSMSHTLTEAGAVNCFLSFTGHCMQIKRLWSGKVNTILTRMGHIAWAYKS